MESKQTKSKRKQNLDKKAQPIQDDLMQTNDDHQKQKESLDKSDEQKNSLQMDSLGDAKNVDYDGNGVITMSFEKNKKDDFSSHQVNSSAGSQALPKGRRIGFTRIAKAKQEDSKKMLANSKQSTNVSAEMIQNNEQDGVENLAEKNYDATKDDFESNPANTKQSKKNNLRSRPKKDNENIVKDSKIDYNDKVIISYQDQEKDLNQKLSQEDPDLLQNQELNEDYQMDDDYQEIEEAKEDSEESDSETEDAQYQPEFQDQNYQKRPKFVARNKGGKIRDSSYLQQNLSESSDNELGQDEFDLEEFSESGGSKNKRDQKAEWKKLRKLRNVEKMKQNKEDFEDNQQQEDDGEFDPDQVGTSTDPQFVDNLPNKIEDINSMLREVKKHIKDLEKQFFIEEDSDQEEKLKAIGAQDPGFNETQVSKMTNIKQFWCIPLSVNVTQFEFQKLAEAQKQNSNGQLFDIITIDPPWQLSSANPTRGVAIAYDTLNDKQILDMPFNLIQTDGFLFIWVINAKYRFALDIFSKFGYKMVDEIAWVKQTVNGKIAKGHGYYLQHAKETCLIGVKGDVKNKARFNIFSDVIFSQRRGQSQKPEEIYEIAEALVPNGYYIEIFGRRNNLHNGWVTVGNEI